MRILQRIWPFSKEDTPLSVILENALLSNRTLPTEQDLVMASALLAKEKTFKDIVSNFVEHAQDISRVDTAAFYIPKETDDRKSDLKLYYKRGRFPIPDIISGSSELVSFLRDCREAVIFNNKQAMTKTFSLSISSAAQQETSTETGAAENSGGHFLKEILLNQEMMSGMALPIITPQREIGVLFVGSQIPCFFNRRLFHFLDSYTKIAGGAMQTMLLAGENRESLQKIDALERYQDNVFNSMTNMIITTDPAGKIYYFNEAAASSMGLEEKDIGTSFEEKFKNSLSSKTINIILKCLEDGNEILGLEGIYHSGEKELDYSLNVTPLKTPRGRKEGLTLLFTNQSREKELKQAVETVAEERRVIKDMFARYISKEVMSNLMESPGSIKLGGDKRVATVFFADIRGYTSFSEGREPEKIVEILNEYFSAAVENIVFHKGYIDKFIGDCIMAVWGVPMMSDKSDAVNAVYCALALQELVRSTKRNFFQRDAAHLRIGIGVNTGPLVAGNLGSMQRMDYSVIGDTVNLASRLESVAEADEIIISQATREYIGDIFKLEKRPDVRVKGKEKPIQIYNVLGINQ
jgi:PAS domain S-box-containing protein